MNHHQSCVLIESLLGNWSLLLPPPLLLTRNQPIGTRGPDLPFYLQQYLILLFMVSWSCISSVLPIWFSMLYIYIFSFGHQACGNHQLNLPLSPTVTHNLVVTYTHHPSSILLQQMLLDLVGITLWVLLPTIPFIGLIGWRTLQSIFHL